MKRVYASAGFCLLLVVTHIGAPVLTQGSAEANELRTYGTASKTFLALSAWDFRPVHSAVQYELVVESGGEWNVRLNGSPVSGDLLAPVHLPDGALVTEIEAVFCDRGPTSAFLSALQIQPRLAGVQTAAGPLSTQEEMPGCVDRTVVLGVPVQVDNGTNSYFARVAFLNLDGTAETNGVISFGSMRIGYHLQVSPPPATATFDDVPTNHVFFPFIEALAAAGITSGCSTIPPLYCPDAAITRGQMAAFLSRALGLHFAP